MHGDYITVDKKRHTLSYEHTHTTHKNLKVFGAEALMLIPGSDFKFNDSGTPKIFKCKSKAFPN